MLKKTIIPAVAIMLCLTACGTNEVKQTEPSIISVKELSTEKVSQKYFPVSIKTMEEAGEKLIVKNFEVETETNPLELTEETFEQNGYRYTARDILRQELETETETKLASKQITITSNTKDMNTVLKQAPAILEYSDEAGYKGQLILNTSNVFTESLGSKSYSYTLKETKTYSDLSRNDSYYIPKTVNKNGKELSLANIEWQVSGTTLAGSSLIPSSYTATAYYEGTAYGSKSIGYNTTLTYIGEVSKEIDNGAMVSVIYAGEKIIDLNWLLIAIPVFLLTIGLTAFITMMLVRRNQRKAEEVENERLRKEQAETTKNTPKKEYKTKKTKVAEEGVQLNE